MIPLDLPPAHVSTCHTHRCWHRIHVRRVIRLKWRRIKAHPMPRCTWEPESSWDPATGANYFGRPWARGRYRVRNPHSTAGGKFQILYSTWLGHGGKPHGNAAYAPPLEQETIARRIPLGQWANC